MHAKDPMFAIHRGFEPLSQILHSLNIQSLSRKD